MCLWFDVGKMTNSKSTLSTSGYNTVTALLSLHKYLQTIAAPLANPICSQLTMPDFPPVGSHRLDASTPRTTTGATRSLLAVYFTPSGPSWDEGHRPKIRH